MNEELIKKLKAEPDYYYAWQSNIAMAFQDAYSWEKLNKKPSRKDIHKISNIASKNFLDLLCKADK